MDGSQENDCNGQQFFFQSIKRIVGLRFEKNKGISKKL